MGTTAWLRPCPQPCPAPPPAPAPRAQEEEERRRARRRKKGRIRELEEIRAELAEKELVLLEKEQAGGRGGHSGREALLCGGPLCGGPGGAASLTPHPHPYPHAHPIIHPPACPPTPSRPPSAASEASWRLEDSCAGLVGMGAGSRWAHGWAGVYGSPPGLFDILVGGVGSQGGAIPALHGPCWEEQGTGSQPAEGPLVPCGGPAVPASLLCSPALQELLEKEQTLMVLREEVRGPHSPPAVPFLSPFAAAACLSVEAAALWQRPCPGMRLGI